MAGRGVKDSENDDPRYLTTREVANLLRVKERKVYDLAAAEEIPHRRITGKLLFPANEIESWIEGNGQPAGRDRPNVLAGSHDPLLDWAIRASGCGIATLCNGSRDGLEKFTAGDAALAGIHLPEEGDWNIASVSALPLTNAVLVAWAERRRGLLVAQESAAEIHSLADLKGRRVALRQPGAGTSVLFSQLVSEAGLAEDDFRCSDGPAHTESDAAAAVAAGEAEATLGLEAMARQFKLAFVPLRQEKFDLLIDRKSYFKEPVQTLFAFARTQHFRDKAASLGGYALDDTGTVRWLSA
ncbi:helix-turn-helix domain-containing protein [Rhodobacterales bacterium]|nr:helix-turn-helix domain-containing protein [Rhodobacterales bacterium]